MLAALPDQAQGCHHRTQLNSLACSLTALDVQTAT